MQNLLLAAMILWLGPTVAIDDRVWLGLAGHWRGVGVFQGQPATGEMTWDSILSGRFTRLRVSLAMGGKPVFEGHAYYSTGPATGTWFDSQGAKYGIEGAVAGDSLVSLWGPEPGRPVGRTVYRLMGGDSLVVADYLNRAGSWKEFGRITYRREGK